MRFCFRKSIESVGEMYQVDAQSDEIVLVLTSMNVVKSSGEIAMISTSGERPTRNFLHTICQPFTVKNCATICSPISPSFFLQRCRLCFSVNGADVFAALRVFFGINLPFSCRNICQMYAMVRVRHDIERKCLVIMLSSIGNAVSVNSLLITNT